LYVPRIAMAGFGAAVWALPGAAASAAAETPCFIKARRVQFVAVNDLLSFQ
jgi:hypothetical protein